MRGWLFDDHKVNIHPQAVKMGGAWQSYRDGLPEAWDPESISFFKDRMYECGQGAVILDVGANTGSFCLIPAVFGGCFVILAFEPQWPVFRILQENLRLNRLKGIVKPIPLALSDENEIRELKVSTGEGQSGLATFADDPPWIKNYEEVTAGTWKFDDEFKLHRLDLIKTDTEGHDINVLRGMEWHINRFRPGIMLESWPKEEALTYLMSIGYKIQGKAGRDNWYCTPS